MRQECLTQPVKFTNWEHFWCVCDKNLYETVSHTSCQNCHNINWENPYYYYYRIDIFLLFILFLKKTNVQTVYGMKFNIYSMAWYVDAAAARQEPLLQPFQSMSVAELQQSTDFYRVVSTEGSFDRTLMLKLAMTLKKDLLIQGLVEELPLKPRNSVSPFSNME